MFTVQTVKPPGKPALTARYHVLEELRTHSFGQNNNTLGNIRIRDSAVLTFIVFRVSSTRRRTPQLGQTKALPQTILSSIRRNGPTGRQSANGL